MADSFLTILDIEALLWLTADLAAIEVINRPLHILLSGRWNIDGCRTALNDGLEARPSGSRFIFRLAAYGYIQRRVFIGLVSKNININIKRLFYL